MNHFLNFFSFLPTRILGLLNVSSHRRNCFWFWSKLPWGYVFERRASGWFLCLFLLWREKGPDRSRKWPRQCTALQRAICMTRETGAHADTSRKQSGNPLKNKHKSNWASDWAGCEDEGVRGGAKQANRRGILGGPGRRWASFGRDGGGRSTGGGGGLGPRPDRGRSPGWGRWRNTSTTGPHDAPPGALRKKREEGQGSGGGGGAAAQKTWNDWTGVEVKQELKVAAQSHRWGRRTGKLGCLKKKLQVIMRVSASDLKLVTKQPSLPLISHLEFHWHDLITESRKQTNKLTRITS